MNRKLVPVLLCMAFALPAPGASLAAFPGEPGPIVYRKTFTREADGGRFRTSGGLFIHGPRLGEPPRQLTFDPGDQAASFSADGRKIIFESQIDRFSFGIFVMNRDGSGRRLVTEEGGQAAFFPDSRRIVFRDSRIFSIRIDGTGLRQLTNGPGIDHEPVVSPDGKTIAFVKTRKGREDIFAIGRAGGRPRLLIDLPGAADADDPEWAPDGRRIVFTGNRGGCSAGIYVARADGRGIRRLTPCDRLYNHPAFSPDGEHVVALGHDNSGNVISLIRSDGGGIVGTIDRGHRKERGRRIDVDTPGWGPRPS
jgi:Tol biopolymer transport system component